jgi:class 3 adenylate cyclase/tetratricopeptide (TPR) repeat protein
MNASTQTIGSYLPDLVHRWPVDGPLHRQVEGSLVSADISGFTALSERLAAHGREGAEELTFLLNQCFGGMIEIIDGYGGDVLKFGGDALLVLFGGPEHTARSAAACVEMRSLIERRWSTTLVKRIELGISQGIHSGTFDLHLVDAGHRELLVVGPGMSATVECEGAAERGQILLSHDAAALLDDAHLGESTTYGRPLTSSPPLVHQQPRSIDRLDGDVEAFVPGWLYEQTAAGIVAEHRTVTVGFVFFGGVDALLEADGPDAVHERLEALANATEVAATRHGIFWLASDVYAGGGKIILTAGAPRSTGHDEDAAVRTARELVEVDVGLPLRIGLNRGPVFMGDLGSGRRRTFTVMGDAVNLAARLMQKSTVGQVVASAAVLDLVPTEFELTSLEPFLVKGKSEPIRAALVGAQRGDDATTGKETANHTATPFVGRQAELRVLDEALRGVREGRGRVVDVVGEPGIGKSRLVDHLLEGVDGATVLRAKGGLYSRATPYFAVSTMLRQLAGIDRSASPATAGRLLTARVIERAPDLEPWLPLLAIAFGADTPTTPEVERIDPANRADKLREVIIDLLTAAVPGPIVIVVDDAHRLDEASDELFAAIGRRISNRPWLLISARWQDHPTFAHRSDDVLEVSVGPLDRAEIEQLARAAMTTTDDFDDDDLEDLLGRGITNPLFLLELVRSGISSDTATPDSIEALVTARIDTLSASDRLLLREAAVLGSVIDTHLLAEAVGTNDLRRPARWSSLSGFLTSEGESTLRFQQGLYREVAYNGLSFRRRRQLHAGIGRVLERRAGEDWISSSELLSLHFHEARDWDRSWRYSVIAGDRAESKYAHAEAADFYRRALSVPKSHRPSPTAFASVAETLADVLEVSGRYEDAAGALALARKIPSQLADEIRLMRKQGVLCERQAKYTQALRWYGRGLTAAAQLGVPQSERAQGELALAYAGVRLRQGRLRDSVEWAHRAERIAHELQEQKMLAHSSYLLMSGYGMLRRPEAVHYRTVPLALFEELADLTGQANVLNNLGNDAQDESRWIEALDYYQRSRHLRDEAGDVTGAATAALNIGEILSNQGHLDDAELLFAEAGRSFRRSGYEVGVAVATSYHGRLLARRGDYRTARSMLSDAVERFARIGASHFAVETKSFQLECEVLAGNGRSAADAAPALLQVAREVGDPLLETIILRALGWAHLIEGEYAEAERIADQCLQLSDEVGSRYERALALIMRGQALAATGRDRRPNHTEARRILSDLGVVALPRRAGQAPERAVANQV